MPALVTVMESRGRPVLPASPAILQTPVLFDVIEVAPGVFDFVGSARGRIVMDVNDRGLAGFMRQGVRAARPLPLSRHEQVALRLRHDDDVLVADAGSLREWNVKFTGAEKVDVRGVEIQQAGMEAHALRPVSVSPDVSRVLSLGMAEAVRMTINGGKADLIKAAWFYCGGGSGIGESSEDYSWAIARADLALMYLDYLIAGGRPLADFFVRIAPACGQGPACAQSLHDDLLGVLSEQMLRRHFLDNPAREPDGLSFNKAGLYELYKGLAGAISSRPPYDGSHGEYDRAHLPALVFDFSQGWQRGDYVRRVADGELACGRWGTKGDSFTGFSVARHEGVGIELAMRVRRDAAALDDGMQWHYKGVRQASGIMAYTVEAGVAGNRFSGGAANWTMDFSISTGLNNAVTNLDDFQWILSVDTDPSPDGVRFSRFSLVRPNRVFRMGCGGVEVRRTWLLIDDEGDIVVQDDGMLLGGFGHDADESVASVASQYSLNFGMRFMRVLLGEYFAAGNPTAFGPGVFDLRLEAFDDQGALLLENSMQLRVVRAGARPPH